MTLEEYLKLIDDIFEHKKSHAMVKYIVPLIETVNKSCDPIIKKILYMHYDEIKTIYLEYKKRNRRLLSFSMVKLFILDPSILEEINEMMSSIMEWYTLLLILNNKSKCIIHLGLAHSNRLLDFLQEVYGFTVINESGITKIEDILESEEEPKSCITLPPTLEA
jgi:hypothetical protein